MSKIVVIEDSMEVQELLKTVLTLKDFEYLSAFTGKKGLELAKKEKPDLIILDLTLPDIDGIDLCATLKSDPGTKHIPVIMLTARTAMIDKIKGLEIGANDYLVKPFEVLELVARIKVQIRQQETVSDQTRTPLKLGTFEIDPAKYLLDINGKKVKGITPKEFDILYILMKNSPNPVDREKIFRMIWGEKQKENSRVIDIHIANIRKKIGEDKILTIPGKGYLFSL